MELKDIEIEKLQKKIENLKMQNFFLCKSNENLKRYCDKAYRKMGELKSFKYRSIITITEQDQLIKELEAQLESEKSK